MFVEVEVTHQVVGYLRKLLSGEVLDLIDLDTGAVSTAISGVAGFGLPPEAPLAMPIQDLARWDPDSARRPSRPVRAPWLARAAFAVVA